MSMFPNEYRQARPVPLEYGTTDRVVFNFFNQVYAWMAVGLAVTAAVGILTSRSPQVMSFFFANKFVYLGFGLLAFVIAMFVGAAALRISAAAGTALFIAYSALIGALTSYIYVVYDMGTIGAAFLVTGGVFGGMSVFGFVTKRDLTGLGSILIMCVWGLILATVVNVFVASNAFSWIITYAVLAVFIGLTAYDTQKLKAIAHQVEGNPDMAARFAIIGSLNLYVDFINIFLAILRILGSKR
jgi:uncharacterized protein